MSALTHVRSLHDTIIQLVKVVHIVQSDGPDHDVIYSDPQVPFSIFLSIPKKRSATDSLRVAESIIHEAMHLQLTLVEQLVALTHQRNHKVFSPWKAEYRSIAGIIHGLYVFQVIDCFYKKLLALPFYRGTSSNYMNKRIQCITGEIHTINNSQMRSSLSKHGKLLLSRLLASS